jgi:hypothetical protein
MSDELFDKLDVVENKSLFIRKLIERELDMLDNVPTDNVIPWAERFAILRDDVNTVLSRLEMIEKNIPGINEVFGNIHSTPDIISAHSTEGKTTTASDELFFESQGIEESAYTGINDNFKEVEIVSQTNISPVPQENIEQIESPLAHNEEIERELAEPVHETMINSTEREEFESETRFQQSTEEPIHEMKLSEMVTDKINEPEPETASTVIEDTTPRILEFKPPEKESQDNAFVMPEFKPPEQESQDNAFVMPEFKPPEHENQDNAFAMPEFKPPEQENQDNAFVMPVFKPQEQTNQDTEFVMPKFKPPEQENQDTEFVMPVFKPQEQANQDTEFVMPVFKPQEQANQDTGFVMPEFKPPEQENQDTEFVMPEFKTQEQANQDTGFVTPELKPPEKANQNMGFAMPELKAPEHSPVMPDLRPPEGMPTFELPDMKKPVKFEGMPEMQNVPGQPAPSAPALTAEHNSDAKLDKLEGNILMYMPRGAKVKKEIIKSLVSRQFSQEDIDRKIQELVAREVLVLKQENGIEQLHRLK